VTLTLKEAGGRNIDRSGNGLEPPGAVAAVIAGLVAIVVALGVAAVLGVRSRRARFRSATAPVLTGDELGAPLGERATLVQFSTAFCAPCRGARQVLARVADTTEGVSHVEIDATTRMDLVRRFNVTSTPTILVLGPSGAVTRRASGMPRLADVIEAVGRVTGI
jgi:thiol-disulfide isomerase/thioredoxin